MTVEVLLSCMNQQDGTIVEKSCITGNAVVINQCDREAAREHPTSNGVARMIDTCQRGLTKSRNLALELATGDICMLSDDDEVFLPDYEHRIREAYEMLPKADVVIFRVENWPCSLGDRVRRLRFPKTMKVSSVQISFRRESLMRSGVRFDELLGSGSGNGAEEELKFLRDCEKRGLRIYYVPVEVARLENGESAWFSGFDREFFYRRGGTTRYILGLPLALAYGVYYVVRKRGLYRRELTMMEAMRAIWQGIRDDRVSRQAGQCGKL